MRDPFASTLPRIDLDAPNAETDDVDRDAAAVERSFGEHGVLVALAPTRRYATRDDLRLHLVIATPSRRTVCGIVGELTDDVPAAASTHRLCRWCDRWHRTEASPVLRRSRVSWEWCPSCDDYSHVRRPCAHRGGVTRRRSSRRSF